MFFYKLSNIIPHATSICSFLCSRPLSLDNPSFSMLSLLQNNRVNVTLNLLTCGECQHCLFRQFQVSLSLNEQRQWQVSCARFSAQCSELCSEGYSWHCLSEYDLISQLLNALFSSPSDDALVEEYQAMRLLSLFPAFPRDFRPTLRSFYSPLFLSVLRR
jgi:hypothetical protein